jgi:hypothetical protein
MRYFSGNFVDARNAEEERYTSRRLKNAELYKKWQADATKEGRNVTAADFDDWRTELSNGRNYTASYVPFGEAQERAIEEQNRQAELVRHNQESVRLKEARENRVNLEQFAVDAASQGNQVKFNEAIVGQFGEERAAELISLYGSPENAFKWATSQRLKTVMSDPIVATMTDKRDIDRYFPTANKQERVALEDAVNRNITERRNSQYANALQTVLSAPENILIAAMEEPGDPAIQQMLSSYIYSIIRGNDALNAGDETALMGQLKSHAAGLRASSDVILGNKLKQHLASPDFITLYGAARSEADRTRIVESVANQHRRDVNDPIITQAIDSIRARDRSSDAVEWQSTYRSNYTAGMEIYSKMAKDLSSSLNAAATSIDKNSKDVNERRLMMLLNQVYAEAEAGGLVAQADMNTIISTARAIINETDFDADDPNAGLRTALLALMAAPQIGFINKAGYAENYAKRRTRNTHGYNPDLGAQAIIDDELPELQRSINSFKRSAADVPSNSTTFDAERRTRLRKLSEYREGLEKEFDRNRNRYVGQEEKINMIFLELDQAAEEIQATVPTGPIPDPSAPKPGQSKDFAIRLTLQEELRAPGTSDKRRVEIITQLNALDAQGEEDNSILNSKFRRRISSMAAALAASPNPDDYIRDVAEGLTKEYNDLGPKRPVSVEYMMRVLERAMRKSSQ